MVRTRAIFVFSALFALPALAEEAPPSPTATAKAPARAEAVKKPASKSAADPAGAANMVVTRDAGTGEVRPATAAEREKLLGRRPLASAGHRVVRLPDGSLMAELGEADLSYAVATRKADGTITQSCVHGDQAAANAVSAPAGAPVAPAAADR